MPRRIERAKATPLQQWASWAGSEGAIFLALVGIIYLWRPEFTWYIKVGLGLGIAGLLFYAAVMGPSLGRALLRRETLREMNGAVYVVALLAIFGLVNYVAYRRHTQWDLTKTGRYTLSDQTRQILKKLDKKITVTALYPTSARQPGGADRGRVEDLLKQYRALNDKLDIKFIDPYTNPKVIYEKGLDQGMKTLPMVLFEGENNRREEVTGATERDFTGALLKLTTTQKKKIYFLQGHGELNPDLSDPRTGMSAISAALKAQQHDVAPLTLQGLKPSVPADTAVLVVAGPKIDFRPAEKEAVKSYLNGGGHVLMLLGPRSPDLSDILKPWGLTVGPGVVADAVAAIDTLTTPVVVDFEPHDLTKGLGRILCAFPFSRPVEVASPAPAGVMTQALAKTSANSWVEMNPNKVQYDGQDKRGPVALAAVATKDLSGTPPPSPGAPPAEPRKMVRLVVIGSADFATDYWTSSVRIGNPYLVLNAANWLAEEDALVSIPPKDDQPEQVMLSDPQRRGVAIVNFLVFPVLAIAAGIFTWWRRR
jgi:ABC-type uncharacterized transport system involved in gliding motility auxiliary subunit